MKMLGRTSSEPLSLWSSVDVSREQTNSAVTSVEQGVTCLRCPGGKLTFAATNPAGATV